MARRGTPTARPAAGGGWLLPGLLPWTLIWTMAAAAADPAPRHGLALFGEPAYPSDFAHFDYVNPDAPKGGKVVLAELGSYTTLNPYMFKGTPAAGMERVFDTLMVESEDEPFSSYPLVAEAVELAADRSWVEFTLRPEARFHDGSPITADDVLFTVEALKYLGTPEFRAYLRNVDEVERLGPHRVRFDFGHGAIHELPYMIGRLPVLPAAWWAGREFGDTLLEPPLGSGPYRVARVNPGRSITYERVADYWGADLPVNRGRHNFDTIRHDYYRDTTVALEAFKAGEYDFREEVSARAWATGYRIPAAAAGDIVLEEIPHALPQGMQGFFFNTRRPFFADKRVRRAIGHAFDFQWINRNLFSGAYRRAASFFSHSPLAARGRPEGEELAVLEPYRNSLPPEVFNQPYQPSTSDGSGHPRMKLRKASWLLRDAGWVVRGGRLVNGRTFRPLEFEIMLVHPLYEKVALHFARNLERLGIKVEVTTVDPVLYARRLATFDFDMVVDRVGQSLAPGMEQREYWGSAEAYMDGSRNIAGVRDTMVDTLIGKLITAPTWDSLVQRARALDRVLLWGHYVIPHWYDTRHRVAYWRRLAHPETLPEYGLAFSAWWVEPAPGPSATTAAADAATGRPAAIHP